MTIKKLYLPIKPHQKPRGALNKYGAMCHSMGTYRNWQKSFITLLEGSGFALNGMVIYSICIDFQMVKKKGRKPDVDNLVGGVFDTLVKAGVIGDDNYGELPRLYADAHLHPASGMTIYFTENKKEMLYTIEKFFN